MGFFIRNKSSINLTIQKEKKKNPFCEDVLSEIRQKIEVKIKEGKGYELYDSWSNLTLDIMPNEIEKVNIQFFINFFKDLFQKLNSSCYLKEKKQYLIKDCDFELLNELSERINNNTLTEGIKASNNYTLIVIDCPKKNIFINYTK